MQDIRGITCLIGAAQRTRRLTLGRVFVAITVAAVGLGPALAHATTVGVVDGRVLIKALPGEINNLRIEGGAIGEVGLFFSVAELGQVRLAAGPQCSVNQARNGVRCFDVGPRVTANLGDGDDKIENLMFHGDLAVPELVAHLGDGRDAFSSGTHPLQSRDTVFGDGGPDRLFGGDLADVLIGGTGHDQIDGELGRDRLAGGPGNDAIGPLAAFPTRTCFPLSARSVCRTEFFLVNPSPDDTDFVSGGDGRDELSIVDGTTDAGVSCGKGFDALQIDLLLDPAPAADCEGF
ncbi:MAG TPA: hypothetical protein VF529_19840 [Solirubrobacteraceae bacterium]|jgi:hypothetical protein